MTDNQNPYTPPEAKLEDERRPGSPMKAILVGLAADIGGSLAAGILLTVVYGIVLGASGASPDEIAAAAAAVSPGSWVFVAGVVMGCGFSVWGGYLCARIAGQREYRTGVVVAVISTAVAAVFGQDAYPAGINLALSIATFGAVMFGVRMGAARNRSAISPG